MYKSRSCVLWMVLSLFFISPVFGETNFFDDVMNQNIINQVSELPYSTLNPTINWQENGNIRAWIDLVGFSNLSKDGNTYYILGSPESLAIIRYKSEGSPPGHLDSLDNTITFSQSGNNLTATLTVVLKWHTITCDKQGCYISGRFTDTATFQDSEVIPEQFVMPGNQSVIIKKYNGTYHTKVLSFSVSPAITQIHVTTDKGVTLTHYLKTGIVNYTDKNVPYLNLEKTDIWGQKGSGNISSLRNEVTTDENITNVVFMTPYGTVGANITEKVMPETVIYPGIYGIIFVVLVVLGGIWYMRRFLK